MSPLEEFEIIKNNYVLFLEGKLTTSDFVVKIMQLLGTDVKSLKEPAAATRESDLITEIKGVHYRLCRNFKEICDESPDRDKTIFEISGALEALNACEEFEKFVSKYFGITYNPRTYEWVETKIAGGSKNG